jgi:hypothetical protein
MLGAAIAVALALLAWTAVRWAAPGDAPTQRLADALVAARASVHEAAAVTGPHSFTFTSNVDGGEVWFEGQPVGALPRFHVFGPASRPVTVEFRHPDFLTVEVTHTAPDAVSIRAPFSRPARRSRPQR